MDTASYPYGSHYFGAIAEIRTLLKIWGNLNGITQIGPQSSAAVPESDLAGSSASWRMHWAWP